MPQLTDSQRATLAYSLRQLNPNLTGEDLARAVEQAANVNDDPAKSQALLQSVLPQAAGKVSTDIPQAYQAPVMQLDPYAGTGTSAAEVLKKQNRLADYGSNIEGMNAAEAEYQRVMRENLAKRQGANLAAAVGGPNALKASQESWDALDKANEALTLGVVKRQQEFSKNGIALYKEGVETAGKVLDQLDKSGRFQIDANKAALDQKKLQLELIGTAATAGVTQSLLNPLSPNSVAARNSARAILKQTGLYTDKQIKEMVPDTMSGVEAAPIAAIGGDNLKNLLTKGQTAQANAAAAASAAEAQQKKIESAGLLAGQQYNTQAYGMPAPNYGAVGLNPNIGGAPAQAPSATNAAAQTAIQRQGGTPTGPTTADVTQPTGTGPNVVIPQMRPDVDATGRTKMVPSEAAGPQASHATAVLSQTSQGVNNYQMNGGKDAAMKATVQAPSMGGVLGAGGRNIVNYTNSAATKDYQLAIDRLNAEAAELGLIAGKGSNNGAGAAVGAAGAQLSRLGMPGFGTAVGAAGSMLNGGQPISATTNPKTVQALAIAVQEARARQQAMIPYLQQYARTHGNDISGFVVPDAVTNRVTMVNPQTGEVRLAANAQEAKDMATSGWKMKDTFLGK